MIKLRTEIERNPLRQLIGCREGILLLGSCFTDHIGSWLEESWLPVLSNPFGVLFNPASIAHSLMRAMSIQPPLPERDQPPLSKGRGQGESLPLVSRNGQYYSFEHHGRFSGPDPDALRQQLISLDVEVHDFITTARHLFITFGTSWVYEREGRIVANCHKFPASEFTRRSLTVDEIVSLWSPIIESLGKEMHFIFTVSPIRHVKDTLHGNALSKAVLLLAINVLQQRYPDQVEYLPVYEFFLDDLRDYRFYAQDLVHPSDLAVELVRDFVSDTCFDQRLRSYMEAAAPIVKALQHRPNDPDSPEYQRFLHDTLLRKDALLAQL